MLNKKLIRYIYVFSQADSVRPRSDSADSDGRERLHKHIQRDSLPGACAVQVVSAFLPQGQPAHPADVAHGHHFSATVRATKGRHQLQLRGLAFPQRSLLGRAASGQVDTADHQRRQQTSQPARYK
jgi:hypothetical protein